MSNSLDAWGTSTPHGANGRQPRSSTNRHWRSIAQLGTKPASAIDLSTIAGARAARGDLQSGRKLDEEALAIYREIGDKNREAWALTVLALVVRSPG